MLERKWRGLDMAVLADPVVAALALVAGAAVAWHHPVAPAAVLAVFLLCCAVLAWRPGIWLFIVPAALPLLNFAPWTGWLVFEEFDLLMLAVAAGAHAHDAFAARATRRESDPLPSDRRAFVGLAVLFGATGGVALVRGMSMAGGTSLGWFQGYADPLNSWRVFKSLLYAALVWPLLRREIQTAAAVAVRRVSLGMLVGLAVVSLAVVWERLAYTGLWDFSSPYRTTALFWEMHVGGAAIDAYLALATPFVAWALWTTHSPLRWAAAAALALLTGYACLTTFSRGVYLAVAASLMLVGLLLARQRVDGDVRASALRALGVAVLLLSTATCLALAFDAWGYAGAGLVPLGAGFVLFAQKRRKAPVHWRMAATLALGLALALEVVAVLGLGSYMRGRLALIAQDRGSRLAHWQGGLGLMHGATDWILGIGLGRLPEAYARGVPAQEFPGDVQFVRSGPDGRSGSVWLLGPKLRSHLPGLLALTQRVALRPVLPYEVGFDVRARTQTDLYIRLCEMHLLYPRNCQAAFVRVPADEAEWRHIAVRLRGPLLDAGRAWAPRLAVFSMAVLNTGGAAEFDNISLLGPDRSEALANRDFSQSLAHWFPAAQVYFVPWHIDNLYLEVLVERGVPALLAFVLCMGIMLRRLAAAAGHGVPIAPFLAGSLCGGLFVGAVSSVMDVPRVAFLLLLLSLFAVEITCDQGRTN
jgi:hypothetical protein